MNCPICRHGLTIEGTATVTLERGAVTVVYKDVPAQVCENCGEEFLDEATTAVLLKHAEEAVAAGVQVEVRSFAA
jgi:YgiT-type zinc finger domain-containing protein